ncbi:Nucleoside-diphosphate-sugar epimerase [Erythrobacter litoralis]|uniref:Epimerase n=1 Tax=Erythrobacter litoralis TaxID=39960 RepID=A0A074MB20_9SPHN|nr:NAD-dependent epimerase/dehydratase family protein [Erythrobacter litoralis]AOL22154.1 Nucleoside-diphosphate-sugar epimerase [Erythrobacter litoralis]KEO90594.1 epimerase [Erythrobacter litoralis]MEE4338553.1 NAD-dependent epimerase/dehydratase family protein [Erythrobacter sp.]
MSHLLIFGLGYTAKRIAARLRERGWTVRATGSAGDLDFGDRAAVLTAIGEASHVLSSVPPDRQAGVDPVLEAYGEALADRRLLYLSSTGVYGDRQGAWVDEATPTIAQSGEGRRNARAEADLAWMDLGARVLRLPGIYGPGRSALDRVREGKARRIDLPEQVFSRVHVDDIASAVVSALVQDVPPGAYNIGDDLPASGNEVTEHACRLLGVEPPPLECLEEANLSEMARGFYMENRRVANGKAKRVLGWRPRYPTYVEGLESLN